MNSWQQINRDNSQRTWEVYTGFAGGTSRFQKIASDVNCADDWLVTPTIELTGNNYLKFKYINTYGFAPIEIWLSDKGSHPDSFDYNILTLTDLYLNNNNDEMIVDLSGFTGEYNIAWRYRGRKSADIYDKFLELIMLVLGDIVKHCSLLACHSTRIGIQYLELVTVLILFIVMTIKVVSYR